MAGKAPQGPTRSRLCLPKTGHGNSVTDTIVDNRERHYILLSYWKAKLQRALSFRFQSGKITIVK